MTLKERREKAGQLAKEIRELADKAEFDAQDQERWDKVNQEYDDNAKHIERLEKAADVESRMKDAADSRDNDGKPGRDDIDGRQDRNRGEVTDETRERAVQAWLRNQCGETVTDEQRDAAEAVGLNLNARHLDINLMPTRAARQTQQAWRSAHESARQERALSAVQGSLGGNTVPETMIRQLEVQMLAFGSVMQAADIIRTDSGEPMNWPTANDTGNKGRQVGENQAVNSDNNPEWGKLTWNAYKFTSDEILIPTELLEDSAFDLNTVITDMLGERIGRILEEKFTTGSGAATPYGIVNAASLGVTAGSATAITADELINLEHSIDPAYRNGSSFMFHDTVLSHLRKLKDGEGRPLWTSGMAMGHPDTIHNRPYFINQEMAPAISSGARTVLFGQLNKYKVRMVRQIRFYRLVERHRENDQDAFLAFVRADGGLLNVGTPVRYLVQP